jgi:hypothetical protein
MRGFRSSIFVWAAILTASSVWSQCVPAEEPCRVVRVAGRIELRSPPERTQMAEFISLLKAQPGCFGNSRSILGDPWQDEPYGYCCTDGKRALLAIHNCCWKDSAVRLELNSAWGLPDGRAWDLYRWYPDPARLSSTAFAGEVTTWLRPFEVVLLEATPSGEPPALDRKFAVKSIPDRFAEPSRSVEITVKRVSEERESESTSLWTPLTLHRAVSAGGAALSRQQDGSILAGGENPSPDTYTITANTDLAGITAFRLEVLPDTSLPGNGPGRAVNGNFALTEFRVTAAPLNKQAAAAPFVFKNAGADFSQQTYGGWPVAAAIDGDRKTGWSVDPQEGRKHVAVFETRNPIGFAGGARLSFVLDQGERGHSIGRLRLSVTNVKPPIPLPKSSGRRLTVKGEAPACGEGGLIVVSVKMSRGAQPVATRNVWNWIETAWAEVAGKTVPFQAVVGEKTHPVCWQAWRIHVEPSGRSQEFQLSVVSNVADNIDKEFRAHFIPNSME